MQDSRAIDIFYYGSYASDPCNRQLKRMFDRKLNVSQIAHSVDWVNRRVPGGGAHVVPRHRRDLYHDRDPQGLYEQTSCHLSFTEEEERFGQQSLGEIGIPNGAAFVCFHSRDDAYLDTFAPRAEGTVGWQYHDYRNSDVRNYLPAAEELTQRGHFAIRMGAAVNQPLDSTDPMIIDYATRFRTDFLDIYLGAKCRFFVCDTAGIYGVPRIFRRPLCWVNYVPLEHVHSWSATDLFIPKKLWLGEEGRFMTFREILDTDTGRLLRSEDYAQRHIEVVESTSEEITAVTVEMDERLNETWHANKDDEKLQKRFWSLFERSVLHGKVESRIGAEFLRQNQDLLE